METKKSQRRNVFSANENVAKIQAITGKQLRMIENVQHGTPLL